jgi:peptidyl-prolyl cis-trans isomerase SurA
VLSLLRRSLARAAAAGLVLTASAVGATTAERVVAVIGDQAVFLSEMRSRARPFLAQIEQQVPAGAQRAAAESELFKQLLDRIVDERIEQHAADKGHLSVTSEEIDGGLRNIASQQNITIEQLVEQAHLQAGLTTQEYRDEIRRQILEGKLLQLWVRGRVRITEDDVRATYAKHLSVERHRLWFRAAWVVLHVPPGASPGAQADREDLADRIAATARAGRDVRGRRVDFADLARSFSDDTPTRGLGGDLGARKPGELAQVIEDEASKLDVGQVSRPFRYKDAIVVLRLIEREPSQLPSFDKARDEMLQRSYSEQMDKARKQWLDEQRRSLYVDVRL